MSVGTRLRYSIVDGPELRCVHCGEWWPIDTECWQAGAWDRCRQCRNEWNRLYQAMRRRDPAFRLSELGRVKKYRQWVMRTHPEYLAAYDRERRARHREYLREYRKRAA
jgi:hypothetical protein